MSGKDFTAAEAFIKSFISKDYDLWEANYTIRDKKELKARFDAFAKEFYSFPVASLIARPSTTPETWFSEAKQYISATIARPLFKIEKYDSDQGEVYAAYTGSNDLGSSVYYEVLIYKDTPKGFKIFSVYHPDFEGSFDHFQGEKFSFSQSKYVDVRKFKAPEDDVDLVDYGTDPA